MYRERVLLTWQTGSNAVRSRECNRAGCMSVDPTPQKCSAMSAYYGFGFTGEVVVLVLGFFNTKLQPDPKRTVPAIICPPCSRCYLSCSTEGCLCSSPQAPQEPAGRQHRQRSPFAASSAGAAAQRRA